MDAVADVTAAAVVVATIPAHGRSEENSCEEILNVCFLFCIEFLLK
jgi:hypothetical protein